MAGALNGYRQPSLMLGTHARLSSRANLAALIDEPAKAIVIFVIHITYFIQAILAHSTAHREFLPAYRASSIRTHSFYSSTS